MTSTRAVGALALRASKTLARVALTMALVAAMTVASLLVHMDTPVVRRVAFARVNQLVFVPLFRGTMTIVALGHVDPFGVSGVSVRVSDPSGEPVLAVDGLASRIALVTLLRTLASGHGDIVIDLRDTSIENVDIRLDKSEDGVAIANSFLPRPQAEPDVTPPGGGRGLRLAIPRVHIGHAWVHGLIPGVPYLDADVTRLDAAFSLEPGRLTADLHRGDVVARSIALGLDANGTLEGHYDLALDETLAMGGRLAWNGTLGQLEGKLAVGLSDGQFDAALDVPQVSPDAIQSLWPGSSVSGTGNAHVEAHGPLEAIAVAAHAGLDGASADVDGKVYWGPDKGAKIRVAVDAVDLHQFATAVAPSSVGLKGDVEVSLSATGRLDGQASLDLPAGHIGTHAVPHATLETHGFRMASGAFGGDAALVVDEPGAPTTLTVHAVPRGTSSSVDFTVVSHAVRLGALRRFSTEATGNARVLGKGNIDLEGLSVDVAFDTQGDTLTRGSGRVGDISVHGRVHGSLQDPDVDLVANASALGWGKNTLSQVELTAEGRALSPHVTLLERSPDFPDVDAKADVDILQGPTFRNVDVHASRLGEAVHVTAERVRLDHGAVSADGMLVEGVGAPVTASFTVAGRTGRLRAHAPSVDLGRLAKLLRLDARVHGGMLALDADVSVGAASAEGTVQMKLDHAVLEKIGEISAHFDGEMRRRRFVGTMGVRAGDSGSVELDVKQLSVGATGGSAVSLLRMASGDVRLEGRIDLAKLAEHLPPRTLPLSASGGTVDIRGRFQRDDASDFTPLVELDATTSGLFLRGARAAGSGGEGADARAPWSLDGVDASTVVRVNGDTGFLELTGHIRDASGDLAVIEARSGALPYRALYESGGQAIAELLRAAFSAHLVLPRRAISSWPAILGRPPVSGDLQADITVEGPALAPHVVASARLASVVAAFTTLTSPLDVELGATYDGTHANVELHGREAGREVLVADGHASARMAELVAGALDPDWSASAKVHVDSFPLVAIGSLDDRQIRGRLTGDVQVDDLHKNARAKATLSVAALKVGDAVYSNATATLGADGKTLGAEVRLSEDGGFASLKATVPASWGAALLPVADAKQDLTVDFQAKHFRAAVLLPFLRSSVDELDGLVDADAQMNVDPKSRKLHVKGTVKLTDGLLEIAALGGELHDIAAQVSVTPDGVLTLNDMTARGVTGEVLASATARLDGLRLEAANATISIPKSQGIPLSVGGALVGTLDGKVNVKEAISADRRTLDVNIDVPTLHLLAPGAGSQDVQPLGPIAGVTIGTHKSGAFVQGVLDADEEQVVTAVTRPEDAVQIQVLTHLGNDVVLRRGADVRIEIAGGPTIKITDKVHVSGQLELKRGLLNLYGKSFEIQHGTVSFVGDDASNPQVSLSASWAASDGTLVIADFIGPLRTGKVTLRSEPALAQNDIVQLLLFGSIQEGQAASAAGAPTPGTSSAEGVAGSLATQPLNRALDQFGLSAVSARVDTSTANAKPELAVQIARDLSVELAYILYVGPPPPGSSPDTTMLTIDWRFLRKWSLDATVGNAGTTIVDLVWKYRY